MNTDRFYIGLLVLFASIPVLSMSACSDDGDKEQKLLICAAGSTQRCICPDSRSGAQSCSDDGSTWLVCVCGSQFADASMTDRTNLDAIEVPDAGVSDSGLSQDAESNDTSQNDVGQNDAHQVVDAGPPPSLDLSGYRIEDRENNPVVHFLVFPEGTRIQPGQTLVVGRNAELSDFEQAWDVSFDSGQVYMTTHADSVGIPIINGGERWGLLSPAGIMIDGITVTGVKNKSYQRIQASAGQPELASDSSSWTARDYSDATPGYCELAGSGAGLFISEWSDQPETGMYENEFIELCYSPCAVGEETCVYPDAGFTTRDAAHPDHAGPDTWSAPDAGFDDLNAQSPDVGPVDVVNEDVVAEDVVSHDA